MSEPRLVAVGRVGRTHGVRGALKVLAYGETLGGLSPGARLVLRRPASDDEPALTLIEVKQQGKHLLMRFVDVDDMDTAQALVGCEIHLPEDQLPPLEDGEYYQYQLIGLNVVTTQGEPVGTLKSIMETGSHDVYVVERPGGEALIPAVEAVIREIDLEENRMVIDPPEGLIDDL